MSKNTLIAAIKLLRVNSKLHQFLTDTGMANPMWNTITIGSDQYVVIQAIKVTNLEEARRLTDHNQESMRFVQWRTLVWQGDLLFMPVMIVFGSEKGKIVIRQFSDMTDPNCPILHKVPAVCGL